MIRTFLLLTKIALIFSQASSSVVDDYNHENDYKLKQRKSGNMLRGLSNEKFGDNRSVDTLLEGVEETKRIIVNRTMFNDEDSRRLRTVYTIPMYFHVIGEDISDNFLWGNGGDVGGDSGVIGLINEAFEGYFNFDYKGIEVNKNSAWRASKVDSQKDREMKFATHIGGKDTLNVWFKTTNSAPHQGDGSWPWENSFTSDGVTMWGRRNGNILVHEIGHWLGLYHIFRGGPDGTEGCDGEDDLVADTPRRSVRSWGNSRQYNCEDYSDDDTCPGSPETFTDINGNVRDPWENYMDYSECTDQFFSRGQMERAQEQYELYRKDFCYKMEVGACRSSNALMISRVRTKRLSTCRRRCDRDHTCRGYEFRTDVNSYRCELHHSTVDYVDDDVADHKCYRKDFNFC